MIKVKGMKLTKKQKEEQVNEAYEIIKKHKIDILTLAYKHDTCRIL